uniref:Thiamine diphosphokinase n=1 Tax=Meloidogyne incognita TaxID=6306 RepID=A0A914MX64_MELIC
MKYIYFIIELIITTFVVALIKEPKEYKYNLLENPKGLIVVFTNVPDSNIILSGKEEIKELPDDWINIWNEASVKICLEDAADKLKKFISKDGKIKDPDMIIGNMDSMNAETKKYFEERPNVQIIQVQSQHKTDQEKAMDIINERIKEKKAKEEKQFEGIIFLGPTHGRMDKVLCTQHTMTVNVLKHPDIPIMTLDGINFMVMIPPGKTKINLEFIENTKKAGIFPVRQRTTKILTKGFKWNFGNEKSMVGGVEHPEREIIEYGGKLSCSNKIESLNDIYVDATEPVLITIELKKNNVLIKKEKY